MLEWTYITNRIFKTIYLMTNQCFLNIFLLMITQCYNVAHYQSIENNLALNYFETLNLSDEIKNDFLKQSLYRLVLHEVGHTLGFKS